VRELYRLKMSPVETHIYKYVIKQTFTPIKRFIYGYKRLLVKFSENFPHAREKPKPFKNDIKKHNLGLKYGNRSNFAFLVIICILLWCN
jgi:hypothetical protein